MVENKIVDKGFVIMLSNDGKIWSSASRKNVFDISTRFYDTNNNLKKLPNKIEILRKQSKANPVFEIKGNYFVEKKELSSLDINIEYLYSINEIDIM